MITSQCRWYFKFQHHDGDEYGHHSIAECFQPIFMHMGIVKVFVYEINSPY